VVDHLLDDALLVNARQAPEDLEQVVCVPRPLQDDALAAALV